MPEVPYRVEKPWGYELIWARTDRYVGKILHVKAGHVLSLQYHNQKDETMHVLSGELILRPRRRRAGGPPVPGGRDGAHSAQAGPPDRGGGGQRRARSVDRRSWMIWSVSKTATEGNDHASHHPARRQGHPAPAAHPPGAQADAQGGRTAGDGLGDGPARGLDVDRADLHHRPSQGAGRGVRPRRATAFRAGSSSRRCRTAPPARSTWRGRT